MSRSYKKYPFCAIKFPIGKKFANRKIRRNNFNFSSKGNLYKRFYNSWEIVDYYSSSTFEEWMKKHPNKDKKELYKEWKKFFHSK